MKPTIKLIEGNLKGLGASLQVGLDDNLKLLDFVRVNRLVQVVERDFLDSLGVLKALKLDALGADRARLFFAFGNLEGVAGVGHFLNSDNLNRLAGCRFLDALAPVVEHGADAARVNSGHKGISLMQSSALDYNCRDNAAALVDARLKDFSFGAAIPNSLKLKHFGLEQNRVQKVVDALALQGADVYVLSVSAPIFGRKAKLCKLGANAVWIGVGLVYLVDRDDNRNLGVLGVVNRFQSLGHDAVVGGDNQDYDVGNLGSAGAHHRKDFVAWCVQEGYFSLFGLNAVSADALGDSAGLAFGYMAVADSVQSLCLSVVNVAHYGYDRRTRLLLVVVPCVARDYRLVVKAYQVDFAIVFGGQKRGRVAVD